jgi:hypothetical protein
VGVSRGAKAVKKAGGKRKAGAVEAMVEGRRPPYGTSLSAEQWDAASRAAEVILRARGAWARYPRPGAGGGRALTAGHAEDGIKIPSGVVGALIPCLVFLLGKVAGLLWERPCKRAAAE